MIIATSTTTHAATCQLPASCEKLITASFSAGGDKTIVNYIQATCETKDGHETYIHEITSWAGLIGFNRITIPDNVKYTKSNNPKFTCAK